MTSLVWVFTVLFVSDRVTMVRNPMVPIKDKSEPSEEIVFQNVYASG